MIKEPNRYRKAGANLHKGILLCGPPGTGKTLIARAIAGESEVNFIFLTGSDFDELFVGVGASRLRKLFETAKKHKPCIIFIDEIDSLLAGSRRSSEHSSSRSTLNQFLAEMDGFKATEDIFVLGATNHENDLDPAAIRPGRFDKKIHITLPDERGRREIIDFYLSKILMDKSTLEPQKLSKMTPGFSGAEIENLVNLASIHSINLKKSDLNMTDIDEARDRILMGIARKNSTISEKRRYFTSLHEAGHTLMCYKDELCRKTLQKVTIIPRGSAEGVTLFLTNEEEEMGAKSEFLSRIDIAMGGHVAEELIYGKNHVTAGCSSDLEKATSIAQNMVKKYGMYGDTVGYSFVQDEGYFWEEDKLSNKQKMDIDIQIKKILKVYIILLYIFFIILSFFAFICIFWYFN
jgi:ATP-dependent metalloprotease FtsH